MEFPIRRMGDGMVPRRGLKMSIRHPRFNPARVAILDPLALIPLPASVAAPAWMDASVHALESYVSLQSSLLPQGITLHPFA